MHHPREIGRRRELVDVLADEQRVGTQENELLAGDQLADDLIDLRMHEGLPAGDGHHRGTALIDGADRLLNRHPLLEHRVRLLDLAAPRAFQVAGEQRLQLDEQRELVPAGQLLTNQVGPDPQALAQRHRHLNTSFLFSHSVVVSYPPGLSLASATAPAWPVGHVSLLTSSAPSAARTARPPSRPRPPKSRSGRARTALSRSAPRPLAALTR